jgi:hypothetical protein
LDDGLHEAAFEKINGDYKTSWRRGCGFIRAVWGLRGLGVCRGTIYRALYAPLSCASVVGLDESSPYEHGTNRGLGFCDRFNFRSGIFINCAIAKWLN